MRRVLRANSQAQSLVFAHASGQSDSQADSQAYRVDEVQLGDDASVLVWVVWRFSQAQ